MTLWDDTWPRLFLQVINRGLGFVGAWIGMPAILLACIIYWRAKRNAPSTVMVMGCIGYVLGRALLWLGQIHEMTSDGHVYYVITALATVGLICGQISGLTMAGGFLACALSEAKRTGNRAQQSAPPLPSAPRPGPSEGAR